VPAQNAKTGLHGRLQTVESLSDTAHIAIETDSMGDDARFGAMVASVTAAFGDPTRRDIFLRVRANPGMTATEIANEFGVHPNVARHHLDRLAAGGYLRVEHERRNPGAGRPAKCFYPADDDPAIEYLTRRDDLLVTLLGKALELLGPETAEKMAAEVGETYGRELGERLSPGETNRSVRTAMEVIAQTMTAHGFAAHAQPTGTATAVIADQCPFGEAAASHPVLCAVDRGMVKGLLAGLVGESGAGGVPIVLSSKARGDDTCAALA